MVYYKIPYSYVYDKTLWIGYPPYTFCLLPHVICTLCTGSGRKGINWIANGDEHMVASYMAKFVIHGHISLVMIEILCIDKFCLFLGTYGGIVCILINNWFRQKMLSCELKQNILKFYQTLQHVDHTLCDTQNWYACIHN